MSLFPHDVLALKDKWIQHVAVKKNLQKTWSLLPWIFTCVDEWLGHDSIDFPLLLVQFVITWAKELCPAELEGDI